MDEITKLQAKIKDLEEKAKEENLEQIKKDSSLEHNLSIINKLYLEKKTKVERSKYSKSCIVAKFQDRELVPFMEAIYNSLNLINKRLRILEEKIK